MTRLLSTVLRALAWTLAVLGLLLALLVLYGLKTHWFPRLEDRPDFDARKAAALTPVQRAAYEHELFHELGQWNMTSKRYPGAAGFLARERRWRQMAAEGFELAALTLNVLDPSGGVVFSPRGPMRRLVELAEQGDTGAMCLMVGLINRAALEIDWRPYQVTYRRWLTEGARLGHPECLGQLGGRLLQGSDGYSRDVNRGLALIQQAVRAGYVHGADMMALHYSRDGLGDQNRVRLVYCWSTVADGVWTFDRDWDRRALLLSELQRLYPPGTDEAWTAFTQKLRESKYTANDCLDMGTGD
jgi:hypothetical protein